QQKNQSRYNLDNRFHSCTILEINDTPARITGIHRKECNLGLRPGLIQGKEPEESGKKPEGYMSRRGSQIRPVPRKEFPQDAGRSDLYRPESGAGSLSPWRPPRVPAACSAPRGTT